MNPLIPPRPLQSLDINVQELFSSANLIVIHEKGEKQENPIDGSFMLQLLLSEYLSKNTGASTAGQPSALASKKVLLVLTHQTERHWNQCCGKLGLNLDALKSSETMTVIDCLKQRYEQLIQCEKEKSQRATDFTGLMNLKEQCKLAIDVLYPPDARSTENRPSLLIIIENLTSSFLNHNNESNPTTDAAELLRFLRTYREQELDTCVATLVKTNIHDLSWTANGASSLKNGNYMANLVTDCFDGTVFEISPLSTGYSDEINGKLCLKPSNKSYHFKIEDKTVRFVGV